MIALPEADGTPQTDKFYGRSGDFYVRGTKADRDFARTLERKLNLAVEALRELCEMDTITRLYGKIGYEIGSPQCKAWDSACKVIATIEQEV